MGECFFLVSAHPGSPGQRAVKWLLLLLCIKTCQLQMYYLPAVNMCINKFCSNDVQSK